jgi:hypothetical protein
MYILPSVRGKGLTVQTGRSPAVFSGGLRSRLIRRVKISDVPPHHGDVPLTGRKPRCCVLCDKARFYLRRVHLWTPVWAACRSLRYIHARTTPDGKMLPPLIITRPTTTVQRTDKATSVVCRSELFVAMAFATACATSSARLHCIFKTCPSRPSCWTVKRRAFGVRALWSSQRHAQLRRIVCKHSLW